MTATQKMTRAEMVTAIQAFDPAFSFSKKKHTVEVLSSILNKATKAAKPKREKGASRMSDGVRPALIDEPKIPRQDSKRYAIMAAMAKGVTVEELLKITGWKRQSVTGALRTDVRSLGFAYEVKGETLKLVVPKGVHFE